MKGVIRQGEILIQACSVASKKKRNSVGIASSISCLLCICSTFVSWLGLSYWGVWLWLHTRKCFRILKVIRMHAVHGRLRMDARVSCGIRITVLTWETFLRITRLFLQRVRRHSTNKCTDVFGTWEPPSNIRLTWPTQTIICLSCTWHSARRCLG